MDVGVDGPRDVLAADDVHAAADHGDGVLKIRADEVAVRERERFVFVRSVPARTWAPSVNVPYGVSELGAPDGYTAVLAA